jgi:hypothetical protein
MIGKPFGDDSSTMTHRVRLTDTADVNPELISWLRGRPIWARNEDLLTERPDARDSTLGPQCLRPSSS